jgi:N-acetyltransferase 10
VYALRGPPAHALARCVNTNMHTRRFRTEAHGDVTARFNERFMLSLADCGACLVCDDELNVLPLSSRMRSVEPLPPSAGAALTKEAEELRELQASLEATPPIGE